MKDLWYDAVIIGGGAAGMAAALQISEAGFSCAIIEREASLGGILMQCIHNGFGLQEFKEELTGPEYAERFIEMVRTSSITVYEATTVLSLTPSGRSDRIQNGESHTENVCVCASSRYGMLRIVSRTVVLAMGCRERNRGNVRIPGSRPAGIFTAGLAQRLVNIEGYIPGKEIVIIGSGDIGLIMARRMSWAGCTVKGVVEIMPYPSGLTRNIVQCLHDFIFPCTFRLR